MSSEDREALRQEMLELVYGCHDDPEMLEAKIANDAEHAALFEEVKRAASVLEAAAKSPPVPLKIETPSPSRVLKRRVLTPFALAASLAVIALVLPALHYAQRRGEFSDAARETTRLIVSGPGVLSVGAPARFQVEVRDGEALPKTTAVAWRLLTAEGNLLNSGYSKAVGNTIIEVPNVAAQAGVLAITTPDDLDTPELRLPLATTVPAPIVHLASDKPAYRPGEVARFSARALNRHDLKPKSGSFHARVVDGQGTVLQEFTPHVQEGVFALEYAFHSEMAGGCYAFEVRDVQNQFTVERLEFDVLRFEAPRLSKSIELDRTSYPPGSSGIAEISVQRAGGGGAAGALVEAQLLIDGKEVWKAPLVLDAVGNGVVKFVVPTEVERGEARFVAKVNDASVVETEVKPFVVPTGKLLAKFFPEGGELVADRENRLYVEVTDALGRPADARGEIRDEKGRSVVRFESEHQGRGRVFIRPSPGQKLRLRLEGGSEDQPLPEAVPHAVVLRSKADRTLAGEPLRLDVDLPESGPWLVGAFSRGTLIASTSVHKAGANSVVLPLPEGVSGVLRITVFDRSMNPRAERLVHRETRRRVAVNVIVDHPVVGAGTQQRLRFVATDELGKPVESVLGVSVSDRSVRDLVGTDRVGLFDQTYLVADLEPKALEDVGGYLGSGPEAATRVDLVLGTRGWRRFHWVDAEKFVADHGDAARRVLLYEGRLGRPSVVDNAAEVLPGLVAPSAVAANASRWLSRTAMIIGGIAMIGSLMGLFVAARSRGGVRQARLRRVGICGTIVVGAFLCVNVGSPGLPSARHPELLAPHRTLIAENTDSLCAPLNVHKADAEFENVFPGLLNTWDPKFLSYEFRYRQSWDFGVSSAAPGSGFGTAAILSPIAGAFYNVGNIDDIRSRLDRIVGGLDAEIRGYYAPTQHFAYKRSDLTDRKDFTEAVYWNAFLKTDAKGEATAEFDLSDRVTTYEVQVDAFGAGRVGQATSSFDARLPFRIEAALPVEVSEGDVLDLPVALLTESPEVRDALFDVVATGPLQSAGVQLSVPIKDGVGNLRVRVTVLASRPEPAVLLFTATSGRFRDSLRRELRVVPRGFPRTIDRSGVAKGSVEIPFAVPEDFVPGSLRASLAIIPSPLAALQTGIDGLLREPSGCFEQTSATNHPNVLALQFLKATGTEAPAVANKSRGLVEKGYRLLKRYESKSGGFEWFGKDPGQVALTAYGLLQFHDMAPFCSVDSNMLARIEKWLLDRRDGEGGFRQTDGRLHAFGRAQRTTENAYVLYALLATGTKTNELETELSVARRRASETDDSYELAVLANAFAPAGLATEAASARLRLQGLQNDDGSIRGAKSSLTSSRGEDLAVEVTSFAALAFLADPTLEKNSERAISWLLGRRKGSGSFGATQATVMALKALTAYAVRRPAESSPAKAMVYLGTNLHREVPIPEGFAPATTIADLAASLKVGEQVLRIEVIGRKELAYAFELHYHAETPASDPEAVVSLATSLRLPEARLGDVVPLDLRIENQSNEGLPMVLAVVGLPASLEITPKTLEAVKDAGDVDHWELRGRDLVLYFRGFAPNAVRTLTLDTIVRTPGTTTGAASRVGLYYTPSLLHWAAPLTLTIP